ncbi:DJ-1/PfpI family protein [Halobacteria archaeon AArc-curdl1]|uniref:DJ-1/PfpI family protein n=1 Tax=Natronosalvus hydrolyticus TaxID=2979988 RepID=A0AAP3E8J6_9EURY|nr:DJ-1/PfpI family protein [Halobacteria archaeon AArc-curdl1]
MDTTVAEIVLFDGFDELDAIGPFEVFKNGARAGADLETRLVTLEPTETVTASHGLRVEPDGVLGEPDLLVVPGGGWTSEDGGVRRVVNEGRLADAVAAHHERGGTLAAVCTGAMVLATADVLDGQPAITHQAALEDLSEYAEVTDARVVDDGDVLTAGGVTSGIDLALWYLERAFGESVATAVATEIEHERHESIVS